MRLGAQDSFHSILTVHTLSAVLKGIHGHIKSSFSATV